MKFRARILVLMGLVALVGTAFGSDLKKLDRTDAIWNAINDRMLSQQDIWFDEGDFPAAIQILKVEAERYPSNYDVWTNLGWMQENVEDWDAALATYISYR